MRNAEGKTENVEVLPLRIFPFDSALRTPHSAFAQALDPLKPGRHQ